MPLERVLSLAGHNLRLEGCHAAVREDDELLFVSFVGIIAQDPDSVHSTFRRSQANFVSDLISIARAKGRRRADWDSAVLKLVAVHDYVLT